MGLTQLIVGGIALSGPIVILVGIGRGIMCLDRCVRAKSIKPATLSGLCILTLLALLCAILVVWFGYGVAHTGKDATTDFMVVASTVTPAYICVLGLWLIAGRLEKGLRHGTTPRDGT